MLTPDKQPLIRLAPYCFSKPGNNSLAGIEDYLDNKVKCISKGFSTKEDVYNFGKLVVVSIFQLSSGFISLNIQEIVIQEHPVKDCQTSPLTIVSNYPRTHTSCWITVPWNREMKMVHSLVSGITWLVGIWIGEISQIQGLQGNLVDWSDHGVT